MRVHISHDPIRRGDHAVQFYWDDNFLCSTVADFIAPGLGSKHPCVVIATPPHRSVIDRELTSLGEDVVQLRRSGHFVSLDARETLGGFMVDERPDPALFTRTVGKLIADLCRGRADCVARAYSEMVDLLWKDGNTEGAIRLEGLWNKLAASRDYALLCGYSMGSFYKRIPKPGFHEVCAQHTYVLPSEANA